MSSVENVSMSLCKAFLRFAQWTLFAGSETLNIDPLTGHSPLMGSQSGPRMSLGLRG